MHTGIYNAMENVKTKVNVRRRPTEITFIDYPAHDQVRGRIECGMEFLQNVTVCPSLSETGKARRFQMAQSLLTAMYMR